MESELQRVARRNLILQAVFLLCALLFFVFTLIYAVNVIVHHETDMQTARMGRERDARLAKRDAVLKKGFEEVVADIQSDRRTLDALSAAVHRMDETLELAEAARQAQERREMKRLDNLLAVAHQAQSTMQRHDATIMKDH